MPVGAPLRVNIWPGTRISIHARPAEQAPQTVSPCTKRKAFEHYKPDAGAHLRYPGSFQGPSMPAASGPPPQPPRGPSGRIPPRIGLPGRSPQGPAGRPRMSGSSRQSLPRLSPVKIDWPLRTSLKKRPSCIH
eukprot:scaffold16628_cov48-Prasinocladus_malaysianus.AAC.2